VIYGVANPDGRRVRVKHDCAYPGPHVGEVIGLGSETDDDGTRRELVCIRFTWLPAGCGIAGGWFAADQVTDEPRKDDR
jgi:hypothetical protein